MRLFIALPVPDAVARDAARILPEDLPGARRVGPELLHLTLVFLGATPADRLEEVAAATAAAAAGHARFEIELSRLGRFPPGGRPRVLWLGLARGSDEVVALAASVRAELARRQLRFDPKPASPHLTLARVRDGASAAEARAIAAAVAELPASPLHFWTDAVHVVESVLSRAGPRYSSRARVPLGDGPGMGRGDHDDAGGL